MSLTLTLVRHAKSSWSDPGARDFDRPLNARGERNAPEMAHRCRSRGEVPESLLASPARRALDTARAFAEVFCVAEAAIALEPRLYDASLETLIEVLRELPGEYADIMLFGHNPGISELLMWLLGDDEIERPMEVPTCALARLRIEAPSWRDTAPHTARLLRYDFPRNKNG